MDLCDNYTASGATDLASQQAVATCSLCQRDSEQDLRDVDVARYPRSAREVLQKHLVSLGVCTSQQGLPGCPTTLIGNSQTKKKKGKRKRRRPSHQPICVSCYTMLKEGNKNTRKKRKKSAVVDEQQSRAATNEMMTGDAAAALVAQAEEDDITLHRFNTNIMDLVTEASKVEPLTKKVASQKKRMKRLERGAKKKTNSGRGGVPKTISQSKDPQRAMRRLVNRMATIIDTDSGYDDDPVKRKESNTTLLTSLAKRLDVTPNRVHEEETKRRFSRERARRSRAKKKRIKEASKAQEDNANARRTSALATLASVRHEV